MKSHTPNYLTLIAPEMQLLNQYITKNLDSEVALIGQVAKHLIFAGGKRLRPALMLLACKALNYQGQLQYNLAAVVELIHTSTLLHDDVVDESDLRRSKSTANNVFGNAASVLVGDFLYSRSFQMMVNANSMRIMQILADTTNTIATGEVQQLINIHNADLTQQQYIQVIQAKTAKLFEASTLIAAVLSQQSPAIEQACATYGNCLGTAFQIIDDALDYQGNANELGKNLGDDLREGKITLPLILALQKLDSQEQQRVRQIIEQGGSADDLSYICQLITTSQALQETKQIAAQYAQQAITAISILPNNEYKDCLLSLANDLLIRSN